MRLTYNQMQAIMLLVIGLIAGFSIHNQQKRSKEITPFVIPQVEVYRVNVVDNFQMVQLPPLSNNSKEIHHFQDLSIPNGVGKPEYFVDLFTEVSEITGVELRVLMKFAAVESSFNPLAKARSSGATGLFQFTADTWSDVIKKYGVKYGMDSNTPRTDARANALMAGFHIQSNIQLLKDKLGLEEVRVVDIYLTHLLGRTGSLRFLKLEETERVANKMQKAARNNRPFFFDEGKALTRKESYLTISQHIQNKAEEFKIASLI